MLFEQYSQQMPDGTGISVVQSISCYAYHLMEHNSSPQFFLGFYINLISQSIVHLLLHRHARQLQFFSRPGYFAQWCAL